MEREDLLKKVQELEQANERLIYELAYVDSLMRSVGFMEGIATVKATAKELTQNGEEHKKEVA